MLCSELSAVRRNTDANLNTASVHWHCFAPGYPPYQGQRRSRGLTEDIRIHTETSTVNTSASSCPSGRHSGTHSPTQPIPSVFIFGAKQKHNHRVFCIILNAAPAPASFSLLTACLVRLDNEEGV